MPDPRTESSRPAEPIAVEHRQHQKPRVRNRPADHRTLKAMMCKCFFTTGSQAQPSKVAFLLANMRKTLAPIAPNRPKGSQQVPRNHPLSNERTHDREPFKQWR